eukprot:TRINITY_DN13515_c0_g1_i1.p1 TRINITY_DN13515_c0_g1~~TRINITY_DN13515_c0_g1_i1.p1  ORF type:complete len:167 (+),score=37.47 TRINITY_DN13515_c0_g1_i1:59-559(+)
MMSAEPNSTPERFVQQHVQQQVALANNNSGQVSQPVPSTPSNEEDTNLSSTNEPDDRSLGNVAVSNSVVPASEKECFVDITSFLNLPQTVAAKKLGMPTSTLSKRWREAVRNRKWPYRVVNKLDKEITTLLHNIPQGAPIPEDVQEALAHLLRKRQEELRPVVIRV